MNKSFFKRSGFTLIEVLLALVILAISLTALLKSSVDNISNTHRLQEKMISHWVAMQGVTMVQLGLIAITPARDLTERTLMLGQSWYWRVHVSPTALRNLEKITIKVSKNQAGPFINPLIAFRYQP